jgi:choline kinase
VGGARGRRHDAQRRIRQLAARRLMRGVDIGNAAWYDIDTMADLQLAESLLAEQAETA